MAEKCMVCEEPLKVGDRVLWDVSGAYGHADCYGPEREGYVNKDGEPLGPDDPIPTGEIWTEEDAALFLEGEKMTTDAAPTKEPTDGCDRRS